MKKIAIVLSVILLIASLSITAFAETSDLINDYIDITVMGFDDDSAVKVTGIDSLKDDRSVITEEDLLNAEIYNNEHENKMSCSVKLKVIRLYPGSYVNPFIPGDMIYGTADNQIHIQIEEPFTHDPSVVELCTDQNLGAYMEIPLSTDTEWLVVSVEKYGEHEREGLEELWEMDLIAAACDSQMSYEVTFPIPSKYSESTDLKLAKIDKGQVSYMEDIDSDEGTYTIRTNGSAVYVFVGTVVNEPSDAGDELGAISTIVPEDTQPTDDGNNQTTNPSDNNAAANGTVSAAKTADAVNITWLLLAAIAAGVCIMLCAGKKCEE